MKTIIEMAREAGIRDCICNGTMGCLKRFAELVRAEAQAEEREVCAKVLEDRAKHIETNHRRPHYGFPYELRQSIDAIRARGNT